MVTGGEKKVSAITARRKKGEKRGARRPSCTANAQNGKDAGLAWAVGEGVRALQETPGGAIRQGGLGALRSSAFASPRHLLIAHPVTMSCFIALHPIAAIVWVVCVHSSAASQRQAMLGRPRICSEQSIC